MPGKNKHPLLGWHCPAELAAWARGLAAERNVPLSDVLTDALTTYKGIHAGMGHFVRASTPSVQRAQRGAGCPHPKARVHKGLCGACGTAVQNQ